MSELTNILEESVSRLFSEQIDNNALTEIEEKGLPQDLWQMVCELGLPQVLNSEAAGGMDGSWSDAHIVVRLCGYAAVPLPIPEAMLANWLAERASLSLPEGIPGLLFETLAVDAVTDSGFSGTFARVPWGRDAGYFLAISAESELLVIAREGVSIDCEDNLGHDPRDRVEFNGSAILQRAAIDLPPDAIRWLGAMLRSAQIAGASSRCLEIGVQFTSEREQFGRTLSRFQAIQHHLAVMACELASVEAMSATAFRAMDKMGLGPSERDAHFEIAAAKCRASDAVESITKIGHQVHGAIGFTYEYGLHFLTRRLWSWRSEFGGAGEWALHLGEVAKDQGGDQIWATITN